MRVVGFSVRHKEWLPVEVEVSFIPGLPQIHLIGQADRNLKESLIKIKSILKVLQVELPKSKQVVVNLRGGEFKKKSLELEFPILVSILLAVGAIQVRSAEIIFAHGELGLEGQIFSTDMFLLKQVVAENLILSGYHADGLLNEKHAQFQNVKELISFYSEATEATAKNEKRRERKDLSCSKKSFDMLAHRTLKPEFEKDPEQVFFTDAERELLMVASLGRHSLLLMGPRGLGKSTFAEALNFLAEPPDEPTFLHQSKYFYVSEGAYWRPFVRPHHSISHLALIGGGSQCLPGEITRAHGGILLLDEFLEFDPKCQEALREPMQNKAIHLARGQKYQKYDCDFHLVATTNLCTCGQWLPGKGMDCDYSYARCRRYRDKLSGPVVDRFHILSFMRPSKRTERRWSLSAIAQKTNEIRPKFKESRERVVFRKDALSQGTRQQLDQELHSLRRLNASIEVAKTLCTLKGHTQITDEIMLEALNYAWRPFIELKS